MILVFGATGFTGRMVVESLVADGSTVRIAGRSEERLQKLSDQHGGLDWCVADVKSPETVAAAAEGCSVLVTTVGPYTWWGHVAADAALDAGIPYIDITGEPGWLRKVFDEYGPKARGQRRTRCFRRSATTTCPATSRAPWRSKPPATPRDRSTSDTS